MVEPHPADPNCLAGLLRRPGLEIARRFADLARHDPDVPACAASEEIIERGRAQIGQAIGLVRAALRAGHVDRRRIHIQASEHFLRDVPDVPAGTAAEVIDVRVLAAAFEPTSRIGRTVWTRWTGHGLLKTPARVMLRSGGVN